MDPTPKVLSPLVAQEERSGFRCWEDQWQGVEIRFVGRGPGAGDLAQVLAATAGEVRSRAAWLRQVHSARLVEARAGVCGEADGLLTAKKELVLAVRTADCVPVLLATPRQVAAVHAGWRGLAAGIVERAAHRLATAGEPHRAWIGPAVEAQCYEVSDEVAAAVARVSGPGVVRAGDPRPFLDLRLAATQQLAAGGFREVRHLEVCTRCSRELLHSYRRDGSRAGLNWSLIWRRSS
jgi:YfiH family protein